ncbi:MAG: hypothetical protein ACO3VF_05805 [Tamlana sp.]|jgi:hypothetical protein
MELVLTSEDLEPLLKQKKELICEPLSFLTSEYKSAISEGLKKPSSNSIFGIRQRIKNSTTCCGIGVALKLSLFLTVIILIFN